MSLAGSFLHLFGAKCRSIWGGSDLGEGRTRFLKKLFCLMYVILWSVLGYILRRRLQNDDYTLHSTASLAIFQSPDYITVVVWLHWEAKSFILNAELYHKNSAFALPLVKQFWAYFAWTSRLILLQKTGDPSKLFSHTPSWKYIIMYRKSFFSSFFPCILGEWTNRQSMFN